MNSHMHSDNSPDAIHSVMYLAEGAQQRGLMGIAVTDHANCFRFREEGGPARLMQSAVNVAKAKAAFQKHMSFATGVEIGYWGKNALNDRVVSLYPFDFVLGSIHNRPDGSEYYEVDYGALSPGERKNLLEEYFTSMLRMVEWGGFDSLAHMTFPFRSALQNGRVPLDLEPHRELVDEILRGLAEGGKALEINTSGLRSALHETMPPLWVCRRFRELGGEYVTIGSDAHSVDNVGLGIQEGMALLEEAGFRFFAFYRARQPVMLRIV